MIVKITLRLLTLKLILLVYPNACTAVLPDNVSSFITSEVGPEIICCERRKLPDNSIICRGAWEFSNRKYLRFQYLNQILRVYVVFQILM